MTVVQTRRDRRVAKRRREIMTTAKEMFLNLPYAQVNIEDIAEATDISKATVYKYFRSKLDIYSAIILDDAQSLVDQIYEQFVPTRSAAVNLRAMSYAYTSFFFHHPEYFEKLSWFYFPGRDRHLSTALLKEVGRRVKSARVAIEKCLQRGIKTGEFRPMDAKALAVVIYSQWAGLAYLAVVSRTAPSKVRWDYKKMTNAGCDLQLQGILEAEPPKVARPKGTPRKRG